MQRGRVWTAADDGRIAGRHRAAGEIDASRSPLRPRTRSVRAAPPACRRRAPRRDVDALPEQPLLVRRLDLTQRVNGRRQVHHSSADQTLARAVGEGVFIAQRFVHAGRRLETQRQPAVPSSSARKNSVVIGVVAGLVHSKAEVRRLNIDARNASNSRREQERLDAGPCARLVLAEEPADVVLDLRVGRRDEQDLACGEGCRAAERESSRAARRRSNRGDRCPAGIRSRRPSNTRGPAHSTGSPSRPLPSVVIRRARRAFRSSRSAAISASGCADTVTLVMPDRRERHDKNGLQQARCACHAPKSSKHVVYLGSWAILPSASLCHIPATT